MRFILISILSISPIISFCSTLSELKIYEYQNNVIIMKKKNNIIANESCFKEDCIAIKSLRKNILMSELNLAGGKNPGSVACAQVLKGKVIMLKNQQAGTQSFCRFQDGSIISNDSIYSIIK